MTATVSPSNITGKVTFYDGASVIGMAVVSTGSADLTTISLPPGPHTLKAYYGGDNNFGASSSAAQTVTVTTIAGQGFARTPIPGAPNGSPGWLAGDFNGDSKADIAVIDDGGPTLRLLLGNGDGTFSQGGSYVLSGYPVLRAADLNGDGKLDLIILVDYTSISVFLGNGDGTFQPAVTRTPSSSVSEFILGDFNRDGKVDVMLAMFTANTVALLLGTGDGTFGSEVLVMNARTTGMISGDFNGDANLDFVVINFNDVTSIHSDYTVLLGNGAGAFNMTMHSLVPAGNYYPPLAAVDFDHDGHLDLSYGSGSSVIVMPGNGDGTFALPASTDIGQEVVGLAVSDFDGDGNADLIVGAGTPSTSSYPLISSFLILLGDGTGALHRTPYHNRYASGSAYLALGDFNSDHRVDVVGLFEPGFSLYAGLPPTDLAVTVNHSGNFVQGQLGAVYTITVENQGANATVGPIWVTDALPSGLTYANASGTGWGCSGFFQSVSCTRSDNLPAGASYPPISLTVNVALSTPILVTNTVTVSTDYWNDTNAANDSSSDPTSIVQYQAIAFGTLQDRVFGAPPFTLTALANSGLTVAFTASGNCTVGANVVTLTSVGSCTITASQAGDVLHFPAANVVRSFTIGAEPTSVSLTAVPNTVAFGAPIVLTAVVSPSAATGRVAFYDGTTWLGNAPLSAGTAAFTARLNATGIRRLTARYLAMPPYASAVSLPRSVPVNATPAFSFSNLNLPNFGSVPTMGDVNGDGKPDLVTAGTQGSLFRLNAYLGNGDGTFAPPLISAPAVEFRRLALGDFNGDGIVDVVTTNQLAQQVRVLRGNGDGTFQTPVNSTADDGALVVADFNGDGFSDVAIAHLHSIGVLLGKGDGTFETSSEYPLQIVDNPFLLLAVGDFDGDHQPDLVGVTSVISDGYVDSEIHVLVGRGDGTFILPAKTSLDPIHTLAGHRNISVGDLNADGKVDLAILTVSDQAISILRGNGNGTFALAGRFPITNASYAGAEFHGSGSAFDLALADVTGDGKLDVVAAYDRNNDGIVQLFPGNGDGTLQPSAVYAVPTGFSLGRLSVADFNGDGRVDLLLGSYGGAVNILSGIASPFLRITKTHVGNFTTPQYSAPYTITVGNAPGASPTSGTVTVGDVPNTGLTVYSMTGDGWNCSGQNCTRSDVLSTGASYPAITVLSDINDFGFGWSSILNTANLSGGGSPPVQAIDSADLVPYPAGCSLSLGSSGAQHGSGGGSGSIDIITQPGCKWESSGFPPWVTAAANTREVGSGNGTLSYTVSANSGPARNTPVSFSGLNFAGPVFTIIQAGVNQAPQTSGVNPPSGTGSHQMMSFTFTDIDGAQDLDVVNILIKDALDGTNACYLAYSRPLNVLYLVNNPGNALLPGLVLNGSESTANSQCSVNGAGSAAGAFGNTLIVSLDLTFAAAFSGNKIVYLAARDSMANNTGWQPMGTWKVPGGPPPVGPSVTGVNPAHSLQYPDSTFPISFSFADTNGWQDLGIVNILVNSSLNGNQSCYIAYNRSQNVLYLVDDPGTALLPGLPLNGTGFVKNSQCLIDGTGSFAAGNGNTLVLTLNIAFWNAYSGSRVIYMAARSNGDVLNSGWQAVGTRTIP